MKKRFKRMLAMALLAAMILSGGVPALAAEEGADGGAEVSNPLPMVDGFDLRNVYVSQAPGSTMYTITILDAKKTTASARELVYGIAKFDRITNKAVDMPGRGWVSPDAMARVTFKDVTDPSIIITTVDSTSSKTKTPAERFNNDKIGLKYVLPTMNVYNAMQPVDLSEVKKESASVTISNTKLEREYALFDSRAGQLVTSWMKGTGGDVTLEFEKSLFDVVIAVTRVWKSDVPYIVPDTPHVEPGGDVALTKVGFSPRTAMAVLTIQATPGLAYAIAQENGQILNISQRVKWGITAETEDEFNVMADTTNFYSAPAQGNEIRFRVPAGGKYFVVTLFPDGNTSRPDTPYQTESVEKNANILGPYPDPDTGKNYALIVINPASQYSQYAARNTKTGDIVGYYASTQGVIRFRAYMPIDDIEVIARPIPLSGSGEDTPSQGQSSPTQETMPPVLNKSLSGTGETQDGQRLTVGTWDPDNSTFASGRAAVEDALNSAAGQQLDPQSFSGAALAGVASEPFTLIIFYDGSGTPVWALYCYDDAWYSTRLVDLGDGTYLVNFRDGIVGYIDITDLAG